MCISNLHFSTSQVTAIEKDDRLVERLRTEFASEANLTLIHGDALRADLAAVVRAMATEAQQQAASSSGLPHSSAAAAAASSSSSSAAPAGQGGAGSSSAGAGAAAAATAAANAAQPPRIKVVANLPYNITKEFIKAMLPMGEHITEVSTDPHVDRSPYKQRPAPKAASPQERRKHVPPAAQCERHISIC